MRSHRQWEKFFLRVLISLTTLTTLAQVTGADQPSGRPLIAALPPEARTPSKAPESPLLRATNNADRVALASYQGKPSAPAIMAPGTTLFLPVVTYDTGGSEASMVVLADVNGDG